MTEAVMIAGLCTPIVALAGYIVKLHAFDRKDRKELNAEIMSVVKANIEAVHELKAAVSSNTKATDAMHRMVADYIRHPN